MTEERFNEMVGKRIQSKREELGMSRETLARMIGYKSGSSIEKIEHGKCSLDIPKLIKVSQALNYDLDLLTMDEKAAGVLSVNSEKYGHLTVRLNENEIQSIMNMLGIEEKHTEAEHNFEEEI